MTKQLTVFRNIFDNTTAKRMEFSDWKKMKEFFFSVSSKPGRKFDRNDRGAKCTPLISPAVFSPDTTRKNENVIEWAGWAAVDVDEWEFSGTIESALADKCGQYEFVCYSTASSRLERPKFRLVFPLTCNVPADKIRHFWYALNTELDFIGDKQTKDLSRMYYAPAIYRDAHNFIFSNGGSHIDPYELMSKHPYAEKSSRSFMDALPPAMREAILREKRDSLMNTDIHWTSYSNCPFWPKRLEDEYRQVNEAGWYNLSYKILLSIAAKAIKAGYPITATQMAVMFRQFDSETGNWYSNRNLEVESQRALDWVFRNSL